MPALKIGDIGWGVAVVDNVVKIGSFKILSYDPKERVYYDEPCSESDKECFTGNRENYTIEWCFAFASREEAISATISDWKKEIRWFKKEIKELKDDLRETQKRLDDNNSWLQQLEEMKCK